MKLPRIPKRVDLSLGFKVPVLDVDKLPSDEDGRYVMNGDGGECGSRIEVRSSQPLWQKYQTYGHEVVHAAIDFNLWVQRNIVEPLKDEAEKTAKELKEVE